MQSEKTDFTTSKYSARKADTHFTVSRVFMCLIIFTLTVIPTLVKISKIYHQDNAILEISEFDN